MFSTLLLFFALGAATEAPAGGGPAPVPMDAMPEHERLRIWQEILASRERLVEAGKLPPYGAWPKADPPRYEWPVAGVAGDPGVDAISNYVDLDPSFPGNLLDYQCGTRSYDLESGYNHTGIDIFSWPFRWLKMDRDEVEIRAAAPGRIVFKRDGNFDRSCSFSGGSWNAVFIEHDDGSVAWYGHLKSGSVTTRPLGAAVETGERLGVMGSSGISTGPHLHLETYDARGLLIEPFAGPCNQLNAESWWVEQPPYRVSRINRLGVQHAPPEFPSCPQPEVPNFVDALAPGQAGIFAVYYRDQLEGQETELAILRPDGTPFRTWTHESPDTYRASYWYWTRTLPERPQPGRWTFQVRFQEQVEELTFDVGVEVFADGFEALPVR